ncbi:hypothetical protein CC2G_006858 [Coprinopsis cinerea AmutBmut pab1-1]|nr:hypothetical protein CC2G_006858 [Coprinopsis cinerea AmutBmut pab1-1]
MAMALHDVALASWAACNDELPVHLHLSAKSHLVTLERELVEARKRAEELKKARAMGHDDVSATEDQVETYRKLVSPMRRLPPELLAHIVLFSIDEFPRLPHYGGESERDSLERLRRVCKKWKTVIDSSPELWKRLWLEADEMNISPRITARILRLPCWAG